jgi:hypothetical protein
LFEVGRPLPYDCFRVTQLVSRRGRRPETQTLVGLDRGTQSLESLIRTLDRSSRSVVWRPGGQRIETPMEA